MPKRGGCPFHVRSTPTIAGPRWTIWEGRVAWGRFTSRAAADRIRRAYCEARRKGEPISVVEERLATRVPFKEPSRPRGYVRRFPGEG
jgi:hypothetical protein